MIKRPVLLEEEECGAEASNSPLYVLCPGGAREKIPGMWLEREEAKLAGLVFSHDHRQHVSLHY